MSTKMNEVPKNLFPISERSYDDKWAKTTYEYRVLFNSTIDVETADEDDVLNWINEGLSISNSLKRDGIMYAETQIVHLCNTFYASEFQDRHFQNIYEI